MAAKTTRTKAKPRRHATVNETIAAVANGSIEGLLVRRTVTAAVATDALTRLSETMGPSALTNASVKPLAEHLERERARGAPTKTKRAPRRVGEIMEYTSQVRPGGTAYCLVIPLRTIGDPPECSVAFGSDKIIIGRRGEITAADVAYASSQVLSPEKVLEELRKRTGAPLVPPTGTDR